MHRRRRCDRRCRTEGRRGSCRCLDPALQTAPRAAARPRCGASRVVHAMNCRSGSFERASAACVTLLRADRTAEHEGDVALVAEDQVGLFAQCAQHAPALRLRARPRRASGNCSRMKSSTPRCRAAAMAPHRGIARSSADGRRDAGNVQPAQPCEQRLPVVVRSRAQLANAESARSYSTSAGRCPAPCVRKYRPMRPSRKRIASVSTPWRRSSSAQARPSGESGRALTIAVRWPNLLSDTATFASAPPTWASKRATAAAAPCSARTAAAELPRNKRTVALMVSTIPLVRAGAVARVASDGIVAKRRKAAPGRACNRGVLPLTIVLC